MRTTPLGTGLRYLPVAHEGRRQESAEEVAVVRAEVERLAAAGVPAAEVMVVAAYNAQVNALREALAEAGCASARSTSSRGRRRQVVLYSLASSSGEDVPRGLEFLLSRNRLNVAISRAQCLAYLVCSPRLLEVNARSITRCGSRTRSAGSSSSLGSNRYTSGTKALHTRCECSG